MRALRLLFALFLLLPLLSCGNRFDINTERGRQAAIDEANLQLSNGNCTAALTAIEPLYRSPNVNDEVRVTRASVEACFAGFNMISLLVNLIDKPNQYQALAKSLDNTLGDGKIAYLYNATDILTQNGGVIDAINRSKSVNNFLFFLQLATIGAIQNAYGNPDAEGVQGNAIDYLPAAAGTLSNLDACALAAAHSHATDSFGGSDLSSNTQAVAAINTLNARCMTVGFASCASINRVRTACDGVNQVSLDADLIVGAVDAGW